MGPTDLWDAAQVEIFRGPQSTLQGLNALAGAAVIRTQDPTMYWDAKARATLADYDTTSFAAAGGGPILQDELAFRAVVEKRDSDGVFNLNARHRTAVFTGVSRPQEQWRVAARTSVNARIGYETGPFGVALFPNNLFDEDYIHSTFPTGSACLATRA